MTGRWEQERARREIWVQDEARGIWFPIQDRILEVMREAGHPNGAGLDTDFALIGIICRQLDKQDEGPEAREHVLDYLEALGTGLADAARDLKTAD